MERLRQIGRAIKVAGGVVLGLLDDNPFIAPDVGVSLQEKPTQPTTANSKIEAASKAEAKPTEGHT